MTTPKDFFLWLGTIVALYMSVGSLVALLFTIVDQAFSLKVIGTNPYASGMSFAIASLLVVFPTYVYLTRVINEAQRADVTKRDIWVRRWGVYLTLFLAGGGMLIDLITLLYTFLQGEELTTAFILKVLVILALFGVAFFYYLKEVQGYWLTHEARSKRVGVVVAVLVLVSVALGFSVAGSPRAQRLLKYDTQRVEDLTSIQYSVTSYYTNKQQLPASLGALRDPLEGTYVPVDPETGADYEYAETGETTFTLCAMFSLPQVTVGEGADFTDYTVRALKEQAEQWPHEAGYTCFERTIDPDNYQKLIPAVLR